VYIYIYIYITGYVKQTSSLNPMSVGGSKHFERGALASEISCAPPEVRLSLERKRQTCVYEMRGERGSIAVWRSIGGKETRVL